MHRAGARFLACQRFCEVVEVADSDFAALRPPEVEDLAQKSPAFLRGDGEGQRLAQAVELRKRDVLNILNPLRENARLLPLIER